MVFIVFVAAVGFTSETEVVSFEEFIFVVEPEEVTPDVMTFAKDETFSDVIFAVDVSLSESEEVLEDLDDPSSTMNTEVDVELCSFVEVFEAKDEYPSRSTDSENQSSPEPSSSTPSSSLSPSRPSSTCSTYTILKSSMLKLHTQELISFRSGLGPDSK